MESTTYYTKHYFEEYARISLNELLNYNLVHRQSLEGSDRPDLISSTESIGIEVTQAINENEGRRNKLFQCNYFDGECRNKEFEDNAKRLGIDDLVFINDTAVLYETTKKDKIVSDINGSIESKLKLLNDKTYNMYGKNCLLMFKNIFPCSEQDILNAVYGTISKSKYKIKFDIVYVMSLDIILIISLANKEIITKEITDEQSKHFKVLAMEYSTIMEKIKT